MLISDLFYLLQTSNYIYQQNTAKWTVAILFQIDFINFWEYYVDQ